MRDRARESLAPTVDVARFGRAASCSLKSVRLYSAVVVRRVSRGEPNPSVILVLYEYDSFWSIRYSGFAGTASPGASGVVAESS